MKKEYLPNPYFVNHIKTLDSLRGLAALMVCCNHYTSGFLNANRVSHSVGLKFISYFLNGGSAVILFFVLSSYVLTISITRNEYIYKKYIIKRIFRLYPAYWFATIIITSIIAMSTPTMIARYYPAAALLNQIPSINIQYVINSISLFTPLFLAQQSTTSPLHIGNPFNGVTWSLTIEIVISICLPIYYAIIYKFKYKNYVALAFIIVFGSIYYFFGLNTMTAIPYYSIFFIFGIMLHLNHNYKYLKNSAILVLAIILFYGNNNSLLLHIPIPYFIYEILSGIGSVLLIIAALENKYFIKFLKIKILTFYGKISYSFYLLHIPTSIFIIYLFEKYNLSTTYIYYS